MNELGTALSTTVTPVTPEIDKWKLFNLLGYKTHHTEVDRFHNSKARIKVCSAPRRSTKSYAAAKDLLAKILEPNTRTWIIGPTYTLAEKEFRYVHEDLVLKRNILELPKPLVCQNNARAGNLYIKFPWGSIVEGKSADNPESLLGEAVDQVLYSEGSQLARHIRERYVQPTIITRKGTEIIPTTPDMGGEWVHELIEKSQQGDYGIDSFHWDVTANPIYDREEFERAKKFYGVDSPVFREQYLGEWVFYGGRVYGTFNDNDHVIEPFDIPKDWPWVWAIDFGHRDPFVCLGAAVGPDSELYISSEYYCREGKSIREHASFIKGLMHGKKTIIIVGDPAAKQSIEDLCCEGLSVVSANNDRAAGRMRVLEYLMVTEDGVPPYPIKDLPARFSKRRWARAYVFKTCKELLREIRYYRWKEGAQREGDREKTEGEDHAMDALRYLIFTRPSPFKMKPRSNPNSFNGWLSRMKRNHYETQFIGG